jgi:cytochrome c biogenesis protein CcmG, thiol:disulfide interchange protein DsbE
MKPWIGGLLGVALSLGGIGTARAEKDRYNVGEEVPSFTLKAINGEDLGEAYIAVDRYFGAGAKEPKKALVLSFFATHCEPCKREMPMLAALFDAYKAKGLQVLLVSIDKEAEKADVAKTLAKEAGVHFPVLTDRFNIVAKRYFVSLLPNVYLINGEGKVAMVSVGYNEDNAKKLVEEIRRAIGEPTSSPLPESVAKCMGHAGGSVESVPADTEAAATAATAGAGAAPGGAVTNASAGGAEAVAADTADDNTGKGKAKGKAKGKGKGKAKGKNK